MKQQFRELTFYIFAEYYFPLYMRNICLIFLFSFLSCLCVFGQEISNAQYQGDSLISEKTEFDAIIQFEVSDSTFLKVTRSLGATPANAKETSYKDEIWILTNDLESK